jgi:hypothetical protein
VEWAEGGDGEALAPEFEASIAPPHDTAAATNIDRRADTDTYTGTGTRTGTHDTDIGRQVPVVCLLIVLALMGEEKDSERGRCNLDFSSFSCHSDKRREVHPREGRCRIKEKERGERMVLLGPYSGCIPPPCLKKVEWKG